MNIINETIKLNIIYFFVLNSFFLNFNIIKHNKKPRIIEMNKIGI